MKKVSFIIAVMLCFAGTANAQLLKKLGSKMSKAAERAVERKAVQKTTKATEEAFDSTFNRQSRQNGMYGQTKVEPASSYSFDHKAEMQITSGKDVMTVDYFLPKSGDFLCAKIRNEKMAGEFLTVFDMEREAMFTYMDNEGGKMKMGVDFKLSDTEEEPSAVTIKATGNTKKILGYKCQEYLMEREDMTGTVWVTKEVDIRFPSTLYQVEQNKSNQQEWMKDIDGWAMEMEMTDTSRRKPHTIKMHCLSIGVSNFRINSKEYRNIGY